ncbi:hypothetical protein [Xanthomonas euroxanthea]|uniref:Uncharacterized protein n=1 Tax=Xanthomonas euroxanthea TaxID=2259622 RepID=A0AA46C7W0_9XANT|nr:hypothetical protein [Xanthomonas euroxanthea]CAE1135679.1 hypothetical protein XTG_001857 [Xanthomonas euroxanthea]SUZ28070.1 hypothetical protein CPBF424_18720 [Xanthomonas euroxanthea]
MARLAESSVAFALRDWQWGKGLIKKKSRGIFISLSGNADKKFGDLKIGLGDRFYLFEVKSTWDTVEEEWQRPIVKGRKHAHLMLRSVIEGVALENQQAINILNVSLIAHHFVYADVNGPRPKLVIEPYVLGTHRKGGFSESKAREPDRSVAQKRNLLVGLEFLKRYALGLRSKEKAAPGKINFEIPENWSPAQFFGSAVAMLDLENRVWRKVGVNIDDFDRYIQFLCDGKDEQMSAIVATANGSFFAFSESTADLRELIFELREHLTSKAKPSSELSRLPGMRFAKRR